MNPIMLSVIKNLVAPGSFFYFEGIFLREEPGVQTENHKMLLSGNYCGLREFAVLFGIILSEPSWLGGIHVSLGGPAYD